MAYQQPDSDLPYQPYNYQFVHNPFGPHSRSRNGHSENEEQQPIQDEQSLFHHYLQPSPCGRRYGEFYPRDSSNFCHNTCRNTWDNGSHYSQGENAIDDCSISLISTPSGAALNQDHSSMGSWQDVNVPAQSTAASAAGSPSAGDLIPQTQQSIEANWEDLHDFNDQYPFGGIGWSDGFDGFDPSISDNVLNSSLANSGQHLFDSTPANYSVAQPIDGEMLVHIDGTMPPLLVPGGSLTSRKLENHSNPDYQSTSFHLEIHRDSPLNHGSNQVNFSSSSVSIISSTDLADLNRQMDIYRNPTEAVLVEEPMGQFTDNTYHWDPVQVGKLDNNSGKRNQRRQNRARRRGPLTSKVAKGATEIRGIGACLSCRILKITCSIGDICETCIKKYGSNPSHVVCVRYHLNDHTGLLFPGKLLPIPSDNLVYRLQENYAAQYAVEHVHKFSEDDITIDVTPGYGYSSIRLKAFFYRPTSQDELPISVISMKRGTASSVFQARRPIPLALKEITMKNLIKQCDSEIKQMVNLKEDISRLFRPNMSPVSQEILKAIHHHHNVKYRGNQANFLGRTITLFAMFLSIGRIFTLTKESSRRILKIINHTTISYYSPRSISRVLNRQIKTAINSYLLHETRKILEELDARLKKQKREFWADDFCVLSILCLCIEEIQNAIGLQHVEKPEEQSGNNNDSSRASARDCQNLDINLYDRITELFHGMYQTKKASTADTKWLNPIRDGSSVDRKSRDLVESIQHVISLHDADLRRCASISSFSFERKSLVEHMEVREDTSGRLLSRFLFSFYTLGK